MTADTDDDGGEAGSPPPADDETQSDDASPSERDPPPDDAPGIAGEGTSEDEPGSDRDAGEPGDNRASDESAADRVADGKGADRIADGPAGNPAEEESERVASLRAELEAVRADLDDLESHVDERTLHRDEVEDDLKRYVRKRQRRGHATGWGPYLVLLYGTAMTLGAFYYLSDGWAILAMLVIWLSTLGLFVVMLLTGVAIGAGGKLKGLLGLVRKLR